MQIYAIKRVWYFIDLLILEIYGYINHSDLKVLESDIQMTYDDENKLNKISKFSFPATETVEFSVDTQLRTLTSIW